MASKTGDKKYIGPLEAKAIRVNQTPITQPHILGVKVFLATSNCEAAF